MFLTDALLASRRIRQAAKLLFGRTAMYRRMVAQQSHAVQSRLCAKYFPDLTVNGGPFTGLRYPAARASGSSFLPKLAGFYECELHGILSTVIKRGVHRMVDVGCAEGYYAVGMARAVPSLAVEAYDSDAHARQLCVELAKANGVASRVTVKGELDAGRLSTILAETPNTFVLSDCEGFELPLIEGLDKNAIRSATFLIECHDHYVNTPISERLAALLRATHDVTLIASISDRDRAQFFIDSHSPYRDCGAFDRHILTSEGRGAQMFWVFAVPPF